MDINEILGSLSNEDAAKLREAAAGLLKNINSPSGQNTDKTISGERPSAVSPAENTPAAVRSLNLTALADVGKLINSDDDRIRFIEALKPLLSVQRQKKADEAEKMLRLMTALPALKESGILNNII